MLAFPRLPASWPVASEESTWPGVGSNVSSLGASVAVPPAIAPGRRGSEGYLAFVAMRPSTRWFWLCGWAVAMALATLGVSPCPSSPDFSMIYFQTNQYPFNKFLLCLSNQRWFLFFMAKSWTCYGVTAPMSTQLIESQSPVS